VDVSTEFRRSQIRIEVVAARHSRSTHGAGSTSRAAPTAVSAACGDRSSRAIAGRIDASRAQSSPLPNVHQLGSGMREGLPQSKRIDKSDPTREGFHFLHRAWATKVLSRRSGAAPGLTTGRLQRRIQQAVIRPPPVIDSGDGPSTAIEANRECPARLLHGGR
jgi:hypothetical protein